MSELSVSTEYQGGIIEADRSFDQLKKPTADINSSNTTIIQNTYLFLAPPLEELYIFNSY